MNFEILGPLRVHHDGRDIGLKAAKERALLGILLLEHGQVVGVDRVVDELWPDAPPQQPVSSVRVLASRVRRSLAAAGYEDRLRTVPPGYVLAIEPVELDAARFEIAAREGARLLDAGDAARAARSGLHRSRRCGASPRPASAPSNSASKPTSNAVATLWWSASWELWSRPIPCGADCG
ncbi:MAG: hypothetical protein NVSMB16_10860 [Acidimicrobiales bacterium]